LIQEVKLLGLTSIAVPPLGCGNGGLSWKTVKPLIESAFSELQNVQVLLFEPQATPQADSMRVATDKPQMTRARALFISLLELYGIPGYSLTMLEIQKLAYFLQVAGEPLKLQYVKEKYGPYANNLNHVLQKLEGHYIRGYGDRSREAEIYVLSEGKIAARDFLQNAADANVRLERVSGLINGFETPYGMELLATVHWVARENRDGLLGKIRKQQRIAKERSNLYANGTFARANYLSLNIFAKRGSGFASRVGFFRIPSAF